MLQPVGSQPPSVYWRRRLMLLASIVLVVVLLALTVNAMTSNGQSAAPKAGGTSSRPTAAAAGTPSSTPNTSTPRPSPSTSRTPSSSASHTKSGTSTSAATSSSAAPAACVTKTLQLRAVVGKPSYHVGDQPVLQLQVTNTGSKPCVQDLADQQVELRVYNGASRVWASHDCKIEPGSDARTLAPKVAVLVAISWSGLTSQPKCAGTRQRVGAGTYTLYALLSGRTGQAARFTIS